VITHDLQYALKQFQDTEFALLYDQRSRPD
jgi:hypothetical protein